MSCWCRYAKTPTTVRSFSQYKDEIEISITKKYNILGYSIATPEVGSSEDLLESWKFYYPPSFIKTILRKKKSLLVSTPKSNVVLPNSTSNLFHNIDLSKTNLKNEKCIHIDELAPIYFSIEGVNIPFFILATDALISGTIGGGYGYVIEECIKLVDKYEKIN